MWAEIARRLGDQARTRGDFAGVHVCPEDTGDIPDTDEARLVILHPRSVHKRGAPDSGAVGFAQRATEQRGTAHRVNRNMVVFLAADEDRMAELDTAVRDYLGWSDVLAKQDELDLTQNQKNQALDKQRQADDTVKARLLGTYQWALVPDGQPVAIRATKVEGQSTSLAERVVQTARQRRRADHAAGRGGDPPPAQHDRQTAVGRTGTSRSVTCGSCTRHTPICRGCGTGPC